MEMNSEWFQNKLHYWFNTSCQANDKFDLTILSWIIGVTKSRPSMFYEVLVSVKQASIEAKDIVVRMIVSQTTYN